MSERTDWTMVGPSLWAGTRMLMGGARSPSNRPSRSASPWRTSSRRAWRQANRLSVRYWTRVASANAAIAMPTQPSEARGIRSLPTRPSSGALALPIDHLQDFLRGVARVGILVVRRDRGQRLLPGEPHAAEGVGGMAPHPPRQVAGPRGAGWHRGARGLPEHAERPRRLRAHPPPP